MTWSIFLCACVVFCVITCVLSCTLACALNCMLAHVLTFVFACVMSCAFAQMLTYVYWLVHWLVPLCLCLYIGVCIDLLCDGLWCAWWAICNKGYQLKVACVKRLVQYHLWSKWKSIQPGKNGGRASETFIRLHTWTPIALKWNFSWFYGKAVDCRGNNKYNC